MRRPELSLPDGERTVPTMRVERGELAPSDCPGQTSSGQLAVQPFLRIAGAAGLSRRKAKKGRRSRRPRPVRRGSLPEQASSDEGQDRDHDGDDQDNPDQARGQVKHATKAQEPRNDENDDEDPKQTSHL